MPSPITKKLEREEVLARLQKDLAERKRGELRKRKEEYADVLRYMKSIRTRQIRGNWRNRKG